MRMGRALSWQMVSNPDDSGCNHLRRTNARMNRMTNYRRGITDSPKARIGAEPFRATARRAGGF
jgi:hypothetical protein